MTPQEVGIDAVNTWFDKLAGAIQFHDVTWMVGDFNMSLWRVVPALRHRGCGVNVAAWYGWQMVGHRGTRGHGEGCIHFDSMAILVCKSAQWIDRAMSDANLEDADENTRRQHEGADKPMDQWPDGQGYLIDSYKGGIHSAQESLQILHGSGGKPELPKLKQKFIDVHQWDGEASMAAWQRNQPRLQKAAWVLWTGGGHMPLLVYLNGRPRRSDAAELAREERSILRGAGPGSEVRARIHAARGTARPRQPASSAAAETAATWAPEGGTAASSSSTAPVVTGGHWSMQGLLERSLEWQ